MIFRLSLPVFILTESRILVGYKNCVCVCVCECVFISQKKVGVTMGQCQYSVVHGQC